MCCSVLTPWYGREVAACLNASEPQCLHLGASVPTPWYGREVAACRNYVLLSAYIHLGMVERWQLASMLQCLSAYTLVPQCLHLGMVERWQLAEIRTQRWSRARTQTSRPRSRTDPFKAKDRNARGQGHKLKCSPKKKFSKKFFRGSGYFASRGKIAPMLFCHLEAK